MTARRGEFPPMQILYRQNAARAMAIVAGAYLVYYLWWRWTGTLNPDALVFSLVVLAAEVYGAGSFVLFGLMTWDVTHRPPARLRPGLSVDVYVPTYDEDLGILEATLTAC